MMQHAIEEDGTAWMLGKVQHVAFTFTNRCNLRCVYCPQGTHPDEFHADSSDEQLHKIIDYIARHDVRRVSVGYYGETMIVEGWEKHCRALLGTGIHITLVSNFSKLLTPSELDVVSRFSELQISIDSIDVAILKRIRHAIDVRTILYNTQQIQAYVIANDLPMPKLIWTGVLTDQVVMGLRDLVAMAIASGLKHVNFNDVSYFETAKNTTVNVYDMATDAFREAVIVIEDARRLAARHGVEFVIASEDRIEQRMVDEFGPEEYERLTRRISSLDMISTERRTFIYGSGEAGRALRRAMANRQNVWFAGFLDSFKSGSVDNQPILSLADYGAQARPDDQILIASMHEDAIETSLIAAGFTNYRKTYGMFRRNFQPRSVSKPSSAAPVTRSGIQGNFVFAGEEFDGVPPGMTRLCDSPWTEIYFDPKGEAYSCCQRGTVMGLLTKGTSIDDIMNNASYRRLRRQILTGADLDPECARCGGRRIVTPDQVAALVEKAVAKPKQ